MIGKPKELGYYVIKTCSKETYAMRIGNSNITISTKSAKVRNEKNCSKTLFVKRHNIKVRDKEYVVNSIQGTKNPSDFIPNILVSETFDEAESRIQFPEYFL